MICEFGANVWSPFRERMTVVRRLSCSTMPVTCAGSSRTKSPIPYQRSKAINAPAMTSIRKRCAPKPTRTRMSAEPPRAVTVRGRNAVAATIRTTIAATYGIAVATSARAVSPRRSRASSRSSSGCRASRTWTKRRRTRERTNATTIATAPQISRSYRPDRTAMSISSVCPSGSRRRATRPCNGERLCDVLERLALGGDREEDRDETGGDHQRGAEQIAVVHVRAALRCDQRAEQCRRQRRDARADRIEERDRHRAGLEREQLADRQVGGARAGGREEEDDRPADRHRRRAEHVVREEQPGNDQEYARRDVREGDHRAAAE